MCFDDFFSTQSFAHGSLWPERTFIWEPLLHLKAYLQKFSYKIHIPIPEAVYLQNRESIFIGEDVQIDPGVLIQGPCIIGNGCKIHHGAYLRENTILGDGCVIGHGSEIKHSLLLDGAHVTHLCYVGDSIIGPNSNLGAGVKCSNLRLDRKEVIVRIHGERVKTGLKKFGAILGENVQVGCNAVLNPGTLIGKNSFVYPLANIGGTIMASSQVKLKTVLNQRS